MSVSSTGEERTGCGFTGIVADISKVVREYADSIDFSIKMRLGADDPWEVLELAEVINEMPLRHETVHPRIAKQQYKGNLLLTDFEVFASKLRHPIIFNGDIHTPSDIERLQSHCAGVMVGRGLLARPSLFVEYREGREITDVEQEDGWLALIKGTASMLGQRLCGDMQLRDKMKPYWEYAPESMDRKIVKIGRKKGLI